MELAPIDSDKPEPATAVAWQTTDTEVSLAADSALSLSDSGQQAPKPGYKQTEVGVIPEDWEVSTLGELCTTSSGTTPSRAMVDRYYRHGTVNWVKTMDLTNADIRATDELVTPIALKETSLRIYPVGTVLIAMYGGFNQIGRTGLLRIPAAVNQAITAIQPKTAELYPEYLLRTLNYRIDHWKGVASSSRKDPNITSQDIRDFRIAYPELPEQRAIAAALSDVDALLARLDALIAKKRDLKQATMQHLLTGKQRLPGFSGEWEVKRLGDFGKCLRGVSYKGETDLLPYDTDSTFRLLRSNNVLGASVVTDDLYFVAAARVAGHQAMRIGDILICMANGSKDYGGPPCQDTEAGAKTQTVDSSPFLEESSLTVASERVLK